MESLLIRGGTVVDPSQSLHGELDVSLANGRVVSVGSGLTPAPGQTVLDGRGKMVTPGLIDLHVHVFWGVSHYGIEADPHCLAKGVTTVVDAGSAGAQTFPGFRRYVIDVSETRILAFLNISMTGMLCQDVGELEDLRFVDPRAALKTVEAHRDIIQGIKVRLGRGQAGENGWPALRRAREAAEAARLPMMIHIWEDTPMPIPDILAEMRPGDVLTHCFHGQEQGILDARGKVLPEARRAVERGIIFDVGHGRGSFSFEVGRTALAQGLRPGTISSDLHVYNVNGPVYDLVTTMSKFLVLGLSLDDVVRMTTEAPAKALSMSDAIGTLRPGAVADVTILDLREGDFEFEDAKGVTLRGSRKLVPAQVIRGGALVPPGGPPETARARSDRR